MNPMPFSNIKVISKRKQEILDRAQELFNQKGYVAASMRELADELHIKPASLYSHYKSKEEILWEIALRCAKEFHDAVLPLADQDMDPTNQLSKMIQTHVEVIIRNIDAAGIFFKEWEKLNDPKRSSYAKLIQQYEEAFAGVIRKGIDQEVFQAMPAKFATSMLLSSINWIQHWYKPRGKMKVSEIAKDLSELHPGRLGEERRETAWLREEREKISPLTSLPTIFSLLHPGFGFPGGF